MEWCYDYPDKNRLGDQKYLDQWPKLFGDHIHISKNKKYFQAPWTFDRFNCKDTIIYHFHGLKISHNKVFVYNRYGLNHKIINYIYSNYIKALSKTIRDLGLTFNQLKETNDFKHKMKNLLVRFNILQTKKTKFYFECVVSPKKTKNINIANHNSIKTIPGYKISIEQAIIKFKLYVKKRYLLNLLKKL